MMNWIQATDPLHNIGLSALVAAIPVVFIFWSLIRKMKGYIASLLTVILAIVLAVAVYGMPLKLAALSALHGALYGLFPICWIIIGAVFLFNITVKSGQFEIIKNFMASITPDRRLQALLIAFSFGAFLEGAAGFGAPVAISAAMLVGLVCCRVMPYCKYRSRCFWLGGNANHYCFTYFRYSRNGDFSDGRTYTADIICGCTFLSRCVNGRV